MGAVVREGGVCGICGIWGKKDNDLVAGMMKSLRHRGPDGDGLRNHGTGTLGHTRLAIMDPAGGQQPIYSEDRGTAVVANGEIYNFPELRRSLQTRHGFRTRSDSEVLVHLYEEYGPRMVEHIDGMFAFAIADSRGIFMARDPIGIKPLYYSVDGQGSLAFFSELKATGGWYASVHEFPPGSWYHSDSDLHSYYRVPNPGPLSEDAGELARRLRKVVQSAVRRRLMSDVPLGTFLSGGLDSSIITRLVRDDHQNLHTFTAGFEGSSDLKAAREMSEILGTIHHQYVMSEDEVYDSLPDVIYHLESFDQDLVRSAIPCYFTSKIASDYVKVVLTGEGADELFAGYTYYREYAGARLGAELQRSVATMHNINLQRVDRLTMAHSIEARVPFLDLEVIDLAQRIPSELKLDGPHGMEKWILRKAFEEILPARILWRPKEQFDEGSGTVDMLGNTVATRFAESTARDHRRRFPDVHLRSVEEVYYHKLFTEIFPNHEEVARNTGRWALRP
jgi:asparagine synthase (glutamine-hydrolysing)